MKRAMKPAFRSAPSTPIVMSPDDAFAALQCVRESIADMERRERYGSLTLTEVHLLAARRTVERALTAAWHSAAGIADEVRR